MPKEPEANRDNAASSLTSGLYSSVLNQWKAAHTSRLSCGIKSKSERVVGGWEERKFEGGVRKRVEGTRDIDGEREARDRREGAEGETTEGETES